VPHRVFFHTKFQKVWTLFAESVLFRTKTAVLTASAQSILGKFLASSIILTLDDGTIFSFDLSVLLESTRCGGLVAYTLLCHENLHLSVAVLGAVVGTQDFYLSSELTMDKTLKLFEIFEGVRFVSQEVNLSIA